MEGRSLCPSSSQGEDTRAENVDENIMILGDAPFMNERAEAPLRKVSWSKSTQRRGEDREEQDGAYPEDWVGAEFLNI